jgi:hypothetical protein
MKPSRFVPFVASLVLLTENLSLAQPAYTIQPIARLGGMAADVRVPSGAGYQFYLSPLLDDGRLFWCVGTADGVKPEIYVLRHADGKLEPIAVGGREGGPDGPWPKDILVAAPFGINQRGDLILSLGRTANGAFPWIGTYLRDGATGKLRALLVKELPTVQNFTVTMPGGFSPAINDRGDMVLTASVKEGAGASGSALLFLSQDGKPLPILLPDGDLPGGGKLASSGYPFPWPSLTETGSVAFMATRQNQKQSDAYLWEQGTLSPLVLVGADAPGGKVSAVSSVELDGRSRTALVSLAVGSRLTRQGLYRLAEGRLTPLVVPGQEMPGGGTFAALQSIFSDSLGSSRCGGVSRASTAREHVFLAQLEDGSTAAYRLDAEDRLALVLKSGTSSELGTITRVTGLFPAINRHGQVALVVKIDGGPDTLALLSPP